ncbi:MAG: hypothetical protein KGD63_00345 [Candidatus Lokiarchaeota archaeon]|nr:hypothetical protein [Candidatus Lokiarchaeota archaeon]
MSIIKNIKNQLKKKTIEEINSLIIDLSKNPNEKSKFIIEYLINNLSREEFNRIKINLFYFIGRLSKTEKIENILIEFLIDQFQISDQWERREITKSLRIISKNQQLNEGIINQLVISLKEDYIPIIKNILEIILNIQSLNQNMINDILLLSDHRDRDISILKKKIFLKFIHNEKELFKLLDNMDFYEKLSERSFRKIIVSYFSQLIELKPFRIRIENSNWKERKKENFLKELDTFQKILSKAPKFS